MTWTKGLPKVDGDYFCRLNEHDLCPVSFRLENGKIYEYGCGGNLYSQYVAKWDDYEYLGPFSASDAEQLSELRRSNEALSKSLKEFCGANGEAVDRVRILTGALRRMLEVFSPFASPDTEQWREEHEACEYARAALNPQPEKETQGT